MQVVSTDDTVTKSGKKGIVLLNMGGPIDLDAVRPFLYNLFADPDIINLPWLLKPFQKPLAWLIAKFRTPSTSDMYEQIGGGSPILQITESLGQKIAGYMEEKGINTESVVAMRYTPPRAEEAIDKLQKAQVNDIILFSQYPHYADSTTGSSFRDFYNALEQSEYEPANIVEIDEWGMEEEYIDFWVNGIINVIDEENIQLNKKTHLIFSAHGLPERYIDQGEKYPERIKEATRKIINKLGDIPNKINWHISFQSQAGPVEWTKPYTDELLYDLADNDAETVIIVPIGFVSNHVETYYEIDILYKEEALERGIKHYYRVDVPDDDETYAKKITDMIIRRL